MPIIVLGRCITNMVMRMIGRVRFITGEEMCIIGIVR